MNIDQLRDFLAVVQAGGFSRAAAVLHVSQPTLTRQVKLLEQAVGLRLLERTGRGAVPTEAGVALVAHAQDILARIDGALRDMQERQREPKGVLTVGLPPRLAPQLAADLVARFHARFEHATITVTEGLSLRLTEWLVAGRLDLALLFDPTPSPRLISETLARERLELVSRAALPVRVRLVDVAQRRLVLPASGHALRELIDQHLRSRGLTVKPFAEVDSVQTVLSLVARGLADTVLPSGALVTSAASNHLAHSAIVAPVIRNRLALVLPRARPATRLIRTACELLRELVAQRFGPSEPRA